MTTDFRALCAKVLAYNEGQGSYNFSHLNDYDRDNAAFDAWQEIKAELKSALAEPEPEGPTDEELPTDFIDPEHSKLDREILVTFYTACRSEGGTADEIHLRGLRAVLARWGRPTPRPVPVSERLPGPEDCDAEGRCWVWWKNGVRWVLDEWTHHELREGLLSDYVSHWLPAHALPIPTAND